MLTTPGKPRKRRTYLLLVTGAFLFLAPIYILVHMHRRGKKRVVVKSKTAAKMANFKTVCSYFRDQLNNLINMLMSTEPSFIRCIVPNNHKKPGVVDPFLVSAASISSCGVFFSNLSGYAPVDLQRGA